MVSSTKTSMWLSAEVARRVSWGSMHTTPSWQSNEKIVVTPLVIHSSRKPIMGHTCMYNQEAKREISVPREP